MRPLTRKIIVFAAFAAFTIAITHVVWPPDIASPRVRVLASVTSAAGHSFQVVQYWNRREMYTTELEHVSPDRVFTVAQIGWDDTKAWFSKIRVSDAEGKVFVTFPLCSTRFEYHWRGRAFVAPEGLAEFPVVLYTLRRSSLSRSGDMVTSTESWVKPGGDRLHVWRSNQAMQLSASKPVVFASSVCRRASMLRFMHRGLAAADLVSR